MIDNRDTIDPGEVNRLVNIMGAQYGKGNFDNQDPTSLYCRTALQRVEFTDDSAYWDYKMYAEARKGIYR